MLRMTALMHEQRKLRANDLQPRMTNEFLNNLLLFFIFLHFLECGRTTNHESESWYKRYVGKYI